MSLVALPQGRFALRIDDENNVLISSFGGAVKISHHTSYTYTRQLGATDFGRLHSDDGLLALIPGLASLSANVDRAQNLFARADRKQASEHIHGARFPEHEQGLLAR